MKAWHQIFMLAMVVATYLLWQSLERRTADEAGWCQGLPATTDSRMRTKALILRNAGFTVGYSEILGNPLWVAYRLKSPPYPAPESRPATGFMSDQRSLRGITPNAFARTGYQRGHLAPNYAMYRVHGADAQRDSFLMTNVSPQKPRLNQKAWQRIEEIVMDRLMPDNGPLCVITGPVFDDAPQILESGVAVPRAFYKILVTAESSPRVLAFLVPQDVHGHEPLDRFLVSVDELERQTGLDFLADLEEPLEDRIEMIIARDWGLEAVANLPPRY